MNFLKFNFTKLLVLVFFTTFLVTSCNKGESIIEQDSVVDNSTLKLMKFDNVEHFQAYYEEQNSLYDTDYEQFNEIASAINVNTVHQKLENQVFTNPEDRYMPFLSDPVMASIVNEDFQYQIGSEVFTIINNEFMLRSDANDQNLTMRFRSLDKGNSLNIESIPDNADIVSDESFEGLVGTSVYTKKDLQESLESYKTSSCVQKEASTGWDWHAPVPQTTTTAGTPWPQPSGIADYFAISHRTRAYYNFGYTYEEAEIFGYKKVGGNWVNKVLALEVSIDAQRRTNNCTKKWREIEAPYFELALSKRARVNKSGKKKHQTGDVKGQFRLWEFNGEAIGTSSNVVF